MGKEDRKNKTKVILIWVFILIVICFAVYIIAIYPQTQSALADNPENSACMMARYLINANNTCYDNSTNEFRITIFRAPEDSIPVGMEISFSNIEIKKFIINNSKNYQVRMSNSIYGLTLEMPELAQEKVYIINLSGVEYPIKVEVAPIIKIRKSNKIKTCLVTDSIGEIHPC